MEKKYFFHEELESLEYELPDEILKYKMCGDFSAASEAIDRWMERSVAKKMKTRLLLEKEILKGLKIDFPYNEKSVLELFKKKVPDFSDLDLKRLDRSGMAEWIFLDGEKYYIHNIVRNVMNKDDELRVRAGLSDCETEEEKNLREAIREMHREGKIARRFRLRTSIRLKDELFYPGIRLKAHLPVPAELYQISNVRILDHTECKMTVDPVDSLFRSVCFEDKLIENHEFFVEYEYTVNMIYHDLSRHDSIETKKDRIRDDSAILYTGEQKPHICFTPYLKALAAEIIGEERDVLEKARKIYDYITTKVKYSYMKEYFLIPNISEYCARNLRGDCGVQALLFITLCRICGIPAKWQSGLYAVPGYVGPHDWAMFYAEPYGWLYADPSFGGEAFHKGDEERRKFYFGNMDPFRMAANNAFQQPFASKKNFRPIDPYDNQSGELESDRQGFQAGDVETKKELIDK